MKSREIRLASRPLGEPDAATFAIAEVTLPEPRDGEVLVRNDAFSLEPYMRGRMNDVPSYVPPFELGAPLSGAAVGTVVTSRAPQIPAGTRVQSDFGWREAFVAPASAVRPITIDTVPPTAFLGALGTTGFTAWIGLTEIARAREGQTLFVSAAAGAVGSLAVQFAKRRGLRVVGSASSEAKAAFVRETLGADAAFDYRRGPLRERLREAAHEGIDVYFDNVGGEQLEAAIAALRPHGVAVLCGAISQYNAAEPPAGPRNLSLAIGKRLRLEGFIIIDHFARYGEYVAEVAPLVASGALHAPEAFVDGLDAAPQAFIDLLRPNARVGKLLVRL